jgi:acyl-CoA synthetase (AMP-forming)/AMP-acid ligase II
MSKEIDEGDDVTKGTSEIAIGATPAVVVMQQTDQSDFLLDRLHHNATLYPNKRAMAFITPSSSNSTTNTTKLNIEREVTYTELESETNRIAISLLEEHNIKRGDRYGC